MQSLDPSTAARTTAVLVAAGDGKRMRTPGGERKPFLEIGGRTVLAHTCAAFQAARSIDELVIVARADDVQRVLDLAQGGEEFTKLQAVVPGGASRTASVRAGVLAANPRTKLVAIHDAARLLITAETIDRSVACAAERGAALVAVPVSDTIKESPDGELAASTPDRSKLWVAQTPQVFVRKTFLELLERAASENFSPTDDAALYERFIGPIPIVRGESTNLKLTTLTDIAIAAAILNSRAVT